MTEPLNEHFKGKTVPEHLIEARIKGAQASSETHGTEISGQNAAFADSMRDTALVMALIASITFPLLETALATQITVLLLCGWIVWKTVRSALLGWARLERLHRLIEEERWEIQHHRPQEREELMEMYQMKGFEGPLLQEVLDVLMADDNRLLQVMLTEELGLSLESFEHPLKQASGAFLGAFFTMALGAALHIVSPMYGFISMGLFVFLGAGLWAAQIEKIKLLPSFIWNLALFTLSIGFVHFIQEFLKRWH